MGFFNGVIKALGFDPNDRAIAKYEEKAAIIDSFEESVKKAKESGMNDYITKPVDTAKLYSVLRGRICL